MTHANKNKLPQEDLGDDPQNDYVMRLNGDRLIDAAINALKKSCNERSPQDTSILLRLTSEIEFFKKYFGNNHSQMLEHFSEKFGYSHFKQGQAVFKQGDLGDKFYLILRGKVSILVKMRKQNVQPQKNQKVSHKDEQKQVETKEEDVEVKQLSVGETFGELALIEDKPRAATIICLEDSYFITFDKESFVSILREKETYKLKEEIQQFSASYLLKDFSLNLLKTLYLTGTVATFSRGDILFKQGEVADKLFVILHGDFKVTKRYQFNEDEFKVNELNNNEKKKIIVDVDVAILSYPSPIGEEEFFNGGQREVSVVCESQDGKAMRIQKKDFLRKLGCDSISVMVMQSRAKQKKVKRAIRLEELRVKYEEKKISEKDEEPCIISHKKQQSNSKINDSSLQFGEPAIPIEKKPSKNDNTIRRQIVAVFEDSNLYSKESVKKSPSLEEEEKDEKKKSKKENQEIKMKNLFPFSIFNRPHTSQHRKNYSQQKLSNKSNTYETLKRMQGDHIRQANNEKGDAFYSFQLQKTEYDKKNLELIFNEKSKDDKPQEEINFINIANQDMKALNSNSSFQNDDTSLINQTRSKNKSHTFVLNTTQDSVSYSQFSSKHHTTNLHIKTISQNQFPYKGQIQSETSQFLTSRSRNNPSQLIESAKIKESNYSQIQRNDLGLSEVDLVNQGNQFFNSKEGPTTFNLEADDKKAQSQVEKISQIFLQSLSKKKPLITKSQSNGAQHSISVEKRTKASILSKQCRDFILNLSQEKIKEKAKEKSIQKNRRLYLEEFTPEKKVSTNLQEDDIKRLITEKKISSITKGSHTSQRFSLTFIPASSNSYNEILSPSKIQKTAERKISIRSQVSISIEEGAVCNEIKPSFQENDEYDKSVHQDIKMFNVRNGEDPEFQKNNEYQLDNKEIQSLKIIPQDGQSYETSKRELNISQCNSKLSDLSPQHQQKYSIQLTNNKKQRVSIGSDIIPTKLFYNKVQKVKRASSPLDNNLRFNSFSSSLSFQSMTPQVPQYQQNQKDNKKDKQQSQKDDFSKVRPQSSISSVFKHRFTTEPCSVVNSSVFHVYQCGFKNNGKCQCSNNHLNMLPLKFQSEMIFKNSMARKYNHFSLFRSPMQP